MRNGGVFQEVASIPINWGVNVVFMLSYERSMMATAKSLMESLFSPPLIDHLPNVGGLVES